MEPKNLQQPFILPQSATAEMQQQQPVPAVQEVPSLEPGTLANTLDTFEHQRKARHSPLWGGIEYTAAGIVLGAATAGVGLLAVPWLTYEGICGQGSVREPKPLSLCQDIFFYKGLCSDHATSAAWVHCLKEAGVLHHGRNRSIADVNKLSHGFTLIEQYNRQAAIDLQVCATDNQLNEETRAGIASVIYDFHAESQRLAPLQAQLMQARGVAERATLKDMWFRWTDAVHLSKGVSRQSARRALASAREEIRDVSRQMNEVPQAPAWVRGQPF